MISVVIATLNDEARLGQALEPLVAAAVRGVVREVVVADAGSTDATLEIAEDAGCRVVTDGLDAAKAAAKSDWLLILDPGARLRPDWEERARAHVESGARGPMRLNAGLAPRLLGVGPRAMLARKS
jgi:glycosyltransferase involved in cell wall biosynthesis